MTGLWLIAIGLILVGLIGTLVPGIPGLPLVVAGGAIFAVGSGFDVIGPWQLGGFVGLGLLGMALNFVGNLLGARAFGASIFGVLGALVGLFVGFFLAGPLGLLIGPLLGAILAELAHGRELREAVRSGVGALLGYVFGTLAEVAIALVLVAWFVWTTWGRVFTG
jgi:uncharacterized protein YqgC (DUF456 family)